jgi:aspartate aminotransferase
MSIITRLSDRVSTIEPSLTMSITALANKLSLDGKNIIGFGAGEPDFDTPEPIKQAAIAAIQAGKSKYTPAAGLPLLKSAIVERLLADYNVSYSPQDIVVSCGAKHSLHNAFLAILNLGDEVIVPAPYWVSYPEQIALAGGRMVVVPTHAQTNFKVTVDQLQSVLTPNTRAIVINSPSNPTGVVYSESELRRIAEWAVTHDLWIISDEIYDKLIYDASHVCMASLSQSIKEHTILINGVSKSYAMTGWRIGYLAAPAAVASAVSRLQSHTTSNPTSIAQYAAIEAFQMDQSLLSEMHAAFNSRRLRMIQQISLIDGLELNSPQGAFYAFPSIQAYIGKYTKSGKKITSSITFCEALLEDVNVACVPGIGFGSDGYIRLSYATSDAAIDEGLSRMKVWIDQLS